jgi:cyclopropane fatty-acyl-phospholipid synthase-like methyltransferase
MTMDEPLGTSPNLGFESAYHGPAPPWDIGRPQPALLALARAGDLVGPVLDVGCGTGEHALMAAEFGLEATGLDASPTAIDIARRKAAARGLEVRFIIADALDLGTIGQRFATVLDVGLFHVFSDPARVRFEQGLREIVVPGGRYVMLAFSDRQPGVGGPRRLSEADIRATFTDGWTIHAIEPARLETRMREPAIRAWLSTITRS